MCIKRVVKQAVFLAIFFIDAPLHTMELLAIPAGKMHCAPEEVEVIPPAPVKEEDIRSGFYATLRPIIGETEVNRAVGGAVMSFPASNRALYNYAKHKKNEKSHSNQIIIHTEVLALSNDANKEDLEKSFWRNVSKSQKDFDTRTNWGNASSIDIEKELAHEPSIMREVRRRCERAPIEDSSFSSRNKHSVLLSKIKKFLAPYNPVERLRLEALAKDINERLYWQQFEVQESNDLANRQHRQ